MCANAYTDIRERITEHPKWWDRHGVPRYHSPIPENCSDVYADRVAFLKIECQNCGEAFVVEFASSRMSRMRQEQSWAEMTTQAFPEYDPTQLEYGDPPRHGVDRCAAGDTMTSVPRVLLAAWKKDRFEPEQATEPDDPVRVGEPGWLEATGLATEPCVEQVETRGDATSHISDSSQHETTNLPAHSTLDLMRVVKRSGDEKAAEQLRAWIRRDGLLVELLDHFDRYSNGLGDYNGSPFQRRVFEAIGTREQRHE